GYGVVTDAIYSGGVGGGATQGLKLTTAWGIRGAFNHNWDPYWSSSLFGSYSQVMYDGNVLDPTSAKGAFCNAYNAATGVKSADYSCNPNFNVAQIGVVTRWTPVKNLTFSAEVGAFFLDQKFTGTNTLVVAPPKPIAVYEYKA